ncbi:MAG: GNAT family N-acetyltransferase [Spirochaetaceae bacterium]
MKSLSKEREPAVSFRRYRDPDDRQAAERIWREVGWIGEEEKRQEEALATFLSGADVWLAEMRGSPECVVATMPGTCRYLGRELGMRAVMAVTTSRVARKQGLAGALVAHALAEDARDGEVVSFLGMFDQGFYNRLGFGSGSYEHFMTFDPASLCVEGRARVPHRLTRENAKAVHRNRLRRRQAHGACSILPEQATSAEMGFCKGGFGLGYFDADGELTHHLWAVAQGENGPYRVEWLAYETPEQLLELLRLLKGLGDQVYAVQMKEPTGVRLQDLLSQPFRTRTLTRNGAMEQRWESYAYWQLRILDLEKALAPTSVPGRGEISFNLRLTDPVARYVDTSSSWTGVAGEYVVTLGEVSHARAGNVASLPTMSASINAFSRLWFAVAPATSLALTDELAAPWDLLEELDRFLCLPSPSLDWLF